MPLEERTCPIFGENGSVTFERRMIEVGRNQSLEDARSGLSQLASQAFLRKVDSGKEIQQASRAPWIPTCPYSPEDHYRYVVDFSTISGILLTGNETYGHWEKKSEEEIDMIEAMKEVDAIAPGWKDEV